MQLISVSIFQQDVTYERTKLNIILQANEYKNTLYIFSAIKLVHLALK